VEFAARSSTSHGSSKFEMYWSWFGTWAEEEAELESDEGTNASVLRQSRQASCCGQGEGHGMQSDIDMKMSDQGSSSLCYIGAEKRAACA
jgi:hypothetical protein